MVMAGPMPGSTPIAVPSSTPRNGVQQVRRRQRGAEAVDQRGQCVHQRMPFRMPTGRLDAEAEDEQVPGAERQDERDHGVADVVPAAEREGRAPEQDRAGDRPAERLDEQGVGDEGRREQADGAPVAAARLRSTSSPPSGSPRPPRNTSRARKTATTTSRLPTTIGTAAGPTGPRDDPALGQEQRCDDDEEAEAPRNRATPYSERPCSRVPPWGGRTHARPSSLSTPATRSLSSVRKLLNSSPVTKASVQPWSSRAFFQPVAVVHLRSTASTYFCRLGVARGRGAPRCRASW